MSIYQYICVRLITLLLIMGFSMRVCAQTSDHWETVVSASDAVSRSQGNSQSLKDLANEFSHLPVIVIETGGLEIVNDLKITARMRVIDNGPGQLNYQYQKGTIYDGFIGIEIRGQSSQMFPKKSYSLELRTSEGADTIASLLGLPDEKDWVLYAPYSDKTMLRNALTFHLGHRMGGWQPGNRFCEVWLNGDYIGVYQLIESIKRDYNRVDISKLNTDEVSGDDLTGGYIVKADKTDGVGPEEYFQISPSISYNYSQKYRFTYVYPKFDQIANEQKYYIKKFLTDAENTLNDKSFRDRSEGFRKYYDTKSFVDFQIIQELGNNVDGYRYSTFFYKDKDSKGGKLKAGPLWDFDLCYGNVDYADFNLTTDTWLYPKFQDMYGGRIHWWARMMDDFAYRASFAARWKELRKGPFRTDSIMAFIDNTITGLGDAIDRNYERWPVLGKYVWPNYFVGETYEEEIGFLKDWITRRVNWIDANIMVTPNASAESEGSILVFPNPVRDRINLYFHLKNPGSIRIVLTDLMGHRIVDDEMTRESKGDQYIEFSLGKQVPGFYVLQLFQNDRIIGRESVIIAM